MSFLETIERARTFLERNGRVSLRALKREFQLDADALEELVGELVDVQRVAAREGEVVSWLALDAAETGDQREDDAAPAESAPGSDAERRHLTVLFCDLVDSTRLAASLDAEDWREALCAYQEAATGVIERFDGHVAQLLGDGLLAYFGFPQAHEDDAERAVRAGLGIVDVLPTLNPQLRAKGLPALAVRVGIHTGSAVVGEVGGGEHKETLAVGDTAIVAARLQGEAEAGAVLLSPVTLRLVQGIFVVRDLGARELKGVDRPLHVYRAVRSSGVRSRLDVAVASGLTPLVGRDQELGLLDDCFTQVGDGHGQAVMVSGEAGIGKSRLVQAFRERVAERPHTWLECRASPYFQDSALYPVIELQRQGMGFELVDPSEVKLGRIEAGLAAAGFDLGYAMPLVTSLHSLPLPERYEEPELSPQRRRKLTLELLGDWVLRLGQDQAVVLLVEDLHWMDASTLELLGRILEQIVREPVLLLGIHRPEFAPPWSPRSYVTPIQLSRLTRTQQAELVRRAARGYELADAWVDEIVEHSDGVPLFAEELTKTVVESGSATVATDPSRPALQVPETLQDSLAARLDRLGPVKKLAQLGAVLGREFSYELLAAVSPLEERPLREALSTAVREELFYERGTPPAATYLFKHALLRDVAYESLLRTTRQHYHAGVASALTDRTKGGAEPQPELVAYHLTEAGEDARAIDYWGRAGQRAYEQVAYEEAIRHYRRGISLLERSAETAGTRRQEFDLQFALARTLVAARGYGHLETRQAWERARALYDPDSDPVRGGVINYGLGAAYLADGDMRRTLNLTSAWVRTGEPSADELGTIVSGQLTLAANLFRGNFRASREHAERAMALYDPDRHDFLAAGYHQDVGATVFGWSSWTFWHLGLPDQAMALAEKGVAIARDPYTRAFIAGLAGTTALFRRDWKSARTFGAEAARAGAEQGFPFAEALGRVTQASGAGLAGDDPGAIDLVEQILAGIVASGTKLPPPNILWLAELQLEGGRLDDAAVTVESALAGEQETDIHYRDAELNRLKGEVRLCAPSQAHGEAEALFRRAIDIAQGQAAKSFELRATLSLARLLQGQGRPAEARDLLLPVYSWFTEGFDTQDLRDAKALLQELS